MKKIQKELIVTTPSRIHLGFYGINNNYGYTYGSLGLAVNYFHTCVSISKSKRFNTNISKKIINPILEFIKLKKIPNKFTINILENAPEHVGLGSGSQTTLSIGKALSNFFDLDMTLSEIANIFKRGKRSGIGIATFNKGGFVVDCCKKEGLHPETLFHSKFPSDWRIILLNDNNLKGSFGNKESNFFKKKISNSHNSDLSHIVIRGIIPSIIYKDFSNFSRNITEFQEITSKLYKEKQTDMFLSPQISKIMKYIKRFNNIGIGQSSWGPISYIFVESPSHAKEMIKVIENKFNVYNNLSYKIVRPSNTGHKIKYT
jgi:beta-RFAP synthase